MGSGRTYCRRHISSVVKRIVCCVVSSLSSSQFIQFCSFAKLETMLKRVDCTSTLSNKRSGCHKQTSTKTQQHVGQRRFSNKETLLSGLFPIYTTWKHRLEKLFLFYSHIFVKNTQREKVPGYIYTRVLIAASFHDCFS